MIKAILVFNNHGKPRLSKFYQYFVSESFYILLSRRVYRLRLRAPSPPSRGAFPTTPAALASNIMSSIYPQDKYTNMQRDTSLGQNQTNPKDTFPKFFGSETLSAKFSESFSENYQQTDGVNFPEYENRHSDGYQDLSGTTNDYQYSEGTVV
ncbi:AP-3 complex subunit sigma-1 [Operophtera brumata]|uniref:AP-3 complex subunit sigma-1 n=1 Tax=Operophtera brumata TaxID=104452 RepID=A0A0L7LPB9_OPEBR|nr:AP-3 complex subunit sigma-1 [Operophtera brumata]